MIVAGPMLRFFVMTTMIVIVVMLLVVMMMPMHGSPQYVTGLLMIDLCEPSLPCATMEPSASTTTRTPTNAVMSEVS
jgi:hypothetical protein